MTAEIDISSFIEIYKKFEMAVREYRNGQTVLDYENTLSQEDADRLRICRQVRNYAQHHEDKDFVACSSAMYAFIQRLIEGLTDEAKSRIFNLRPLYADVRLADIRAIFSKNGRNWMPVVDKNNKYLGSIDLTQLIFTMASNSPDAKLSSIISSDFFEDSTIPVIKGKAQIDDFRGKDAAIIDDNGEYLGIYRW